MYPIPTRTDDPAALKRQKHWEKVWSTDRPHEVTCYQESSEVSIGLIEATGIDRDARNGSREISTLLGPDFQLLEILRESHLSPGRIEQRFTYFRLQRQR